MDEMRVEVGVKESSKKKLVRRWVGHVEKNDRYKIGRGQKVEGRGEECRNCDGNCIKSDLERAGD